MHSDIRLVISLGMACVGCLATALFALPAAAGTNSWTPISTNCISSIRLPVAGCFAICSAAKVLRSVGSTWRH